VTLREEQLVPRRHDR